MLVQNIINALVNVVKLFIFIIIFLLIPYVILDELGYTELMSKLPPEEEGVVDDFESSGIEISYPYADHRNIENSMYKDYSTLSTGIVASVSDSTDPPYLKFKTNLDPPATPTIQIFLANPDKDLLSSLNEGDRISYAGVLNGNSTNLTVSDATIKIY